MDQVSLRVESAHRPMVDVGGSKLDHSIRLNPSWVRPIASYAPRSGQRLGERNDNDLS